MGPETRQPYAPPYVSLARTGELASLSRELAERLRECRLCPRDCAVDRLSGEEGFCRTLDKPVISSYGPHFGEEEVLVGNRGSGTIFFTGCNLGCVFCQNYDISQLGEGAEIDAVELARIMLHVQEGGCHNLNLVTPTHQVPQIVEALTGAVEQGFRLPIVYNCGGYEEVDTLKMLDGIVDIYMPDFKYWEDRPALQYSRAPRYPEIARAVVREMHRQVGDLTVDDDGIARRGLLVRHLVLPRELAGTENIMRWLAEEISPDTYVNIMAQYHPAFHACEHPAIQRRITPREYRRALAAARRAGIRRIAP